MVTAEGTAIAELLLDSATAWPPVGAEALSPTEHETDAGPTTLLPLHANALKTGSPVPLRLTVAFGHDVALLAMVTLPEAAPELMGLKVTGRERDCPDVRVTGSDKAEIANPAPATVTEEIVKGPVPLEVKVTDFATGMLTAVEPNASAVEETLNAGVIDELMFSVNLWEIPPPFAVSVAVCAEATEDTMALNPTVLAPTFALILEGTVTEALLLVKVTVMGAVVASVRYTEHALVNGPVTLALPHETLLTAGTAAADRIRDAWANRAATNNAMNLNWWHVPLP